MNAKAVTEQVLLEGSGLALEQAACGLSVVLTVADRIVPIDRTAGTGQN